MYGDSPKVLAPLANYEFIAKAFSAKKFVIQNGITAAQLQLGPS